MRNPIGRVRGAAYLALHLLTLASGMPGRADDIIHTGEKEELSHFSIGLNQGISSIKMNGTNFSGIEPSLDFRVNLSDSFALGIHLVQTLASKPFGTTLRSNLEPAIDYAVTGTLRRHDSITTLNDKPFLSVRGKNPSGLRASIFLDQSFINTSVSTVSLSGIGAALRYEFVGWGIWQPVVGARYESLQNVTSKVTVYGGFIGILVHP